MSGPENRWPSATVEWLVREAWRGTNRRVLAEEICRRLLADGVPLARFTAHTPTLHPELYGDSFFWRRGEGRATYERAAHTIKDTPVFQKSPLLVAAENRKLLRCRLTDPGVADEYPLFRQLAAEGVTEYVALPLEFADGTLAFVTFASDAPGGFSDAHIRQLEDVGLVLARLAEIYVTRALAVRLLDVYVGHDAGERILKGQIRRGDGETINAVIFMADLRGFTRLSDSRPRDEVIGILNDFFDRMAAPVQEHGGQVLKFIGDAVLAVFRTGGTHDAAASALAAARGAIAGMAELNQTRVAKGQPALGFGIALHVGDVMYGNIGARERLDFTVIGPAVNRAERIGRLCKTLDRRLLASVDFADRIPGQLIPLGAHPLDGVEGAHALFGLDGDG